VADTGAQGGRGLLATGEGYFKGHAVIESYYLAGCGVAIVASAAVLVWATVYWFR